MRFCSCFAKHSSPIVIETQNTYIPDLLSFNQEVLQKHLIVDDSSYNRLVLKRFLNFMGFPTDEASSAHEAIQMIIKNGVYDVVWLDYQLSNKGLQTDCNCLCINYHRYTYSYNVRQAICVPCKHTY